MIRKLFTTLIFVHFFAVYAIAQKHLLLTQHDGGWAPFMVDQIVANKDHIEQLPFSGFVVKGNSFTNEVLKPDTVVTYNDIWNEVGVDGEQRQVSHLKNLFTTKPDIFLQVNLDFPGDIFDDAAAWTRVTENFKAVAEAAEAAGLKGIALDDEGYSPKSRTKKLVNFRFPRQGEGVEEWEINGAEPDAVDYDNPSYRNQTYNFSQHMDKVAQRFKDIMLAMREVYPDITVLVYHGPAVSHFNTSNYVVPGNKKYRYNEYHGPIFLGLKQGLNGGAGHPSLYDMGENYLYYKDKHFKDAYEWRKRGIALDQNNNLDSSYRWIVPQADRADWSQRVNVGFMLSNDASLKSIKPKDANGDIVFDNTNRVGVLDMEDRFHKAFKYSDGYVVYYSLQEDWMRTNGTRRSAWEDMLRRVYDNEVLNKGNEIVYEDAEDGLTDRWKKTGPGAGNATVNNVFDADRNSNVIEFSVDNPDYNTFMIGQYPGVSGAWNNIVDRRLTWSAKFSEPFAFYVILKMLNGEVRYLKYEATNVSGLQGSKILHGLGADKADGQWHTYSRDLKADLKAFLPDEDIDTVEGLFVRGSGKIDDIKISHIGEVLEAPTNLRLEAISSTQVLIQWDDNLNDRAKVFGYEIYRDGKKVVFVTPRDRLYYDNNLNPNTTYKYTVKAISDDEYIAPSSNYGQRGDAIVEKIIENNDYKLYYPKNRLNAPVVIFLSSPVGINKYTKMMDFIASQGYYVIGLNYGHYSESRIAGYLSRAASDNNRADTNKVSIVGHSVGGSFAFRYLEKIKAAGYAQTSNSVISLDGWFAFDITKEHMKTLNTTSLVMAFGAVDGLPGEEQTIYQDPRISLGTYMLLEGDEKAFLRIGANNKHMYPADDEGSVPFMQKQDLLRPLHAFLDYTLKGKLDARSIALMDNFNEVKEYTDTLSVNESFADYPCTHDKDGYHYNYCNLASIESIITYNQ